MSKKILSVLLAIALVASCFAVSAFAIGGISYEEDETYTQAWALGEPVDNGNGTWSVDVTLTANYAVGAMQFEVTNTDNVNVKLTGFALGERIPELWYAEATNFSNDSGIVAIIPEPTDDAVDALDCSAGVVVGTLTYTVADGASATIKIAEDAKSATNPGGTLIATRMSDDNVVTGTPIVGQVATVGVERVIGAAPVAQPTLKVIDGTNGVIDDARGYLYGIDAYNYQTVREVFEVQDGSYEIIPSTLSVDGAEGTGAQLVVLDADNNPVKTYTIIIFGDVNGDGLIDSGFDAFLIEKHEGYGIESSSTGQFDNAAQLIAADVSFDYWIDSGTDGYYLELSEGYGMTVEGYGNGATLDISLLNDMFANYDVNTLLDAYGVAHE